MDEQQAEDIINEFNEQHEPLYIVDHENGEYSLCYVMDAIGEDFGEAAFDAYAEERGEPVCDAVGLKAYGSGYDWEDVFRKFFENDTHIGDIRFDCESGGFFCSCRDLEVLADMGHKLYEVASDTEKFAPIVSAGLKEGNERRANEEKLMNTVRGQMMRNPTAMFHIRTPKGDICLLPETVQSILAGKDNIVETMHGRMAVEELLNQTVCGVQKDLLDENIIRMKTEINQEEIPREGLVQKL